MPSEELVDMMQDAPPPPHMSPRTTRAYQAWMVEIVNQREAYRETTRLIARVREAEAGYTEITSRTAQAHRAFCALAAADALSLVGEPYSTEPKDE